MQGRRVPTTKGEFQSLCDLHDAGTFLPQCERQPKMDKKLVDIQSGGPDLIDEISEAKCCKLKIKRAIAVRKHEFGGHGHVRSKIRLFKKEENNRNGSNVQQEITVEVDERVERHVRLTNVVREDGDSRPGSS